MTDSQNAWNDALRRMRRTNPVYKPAVLVAFLREQPADDGSVSAKAVTDGFKALLNAASAPRTPAIKVPLSGLENDGILRVAGDRVMLAEAHRSVDRAEALKATVALLRGDAKSLSDALANAIDS